MLAGRAHHTGGMAEAPDDATTPLTLYELVGGEGWFIALVDDFYDAVVADPVLAPMYPADDLPGARARLAGFLVQYWGGPATYSEQRGHPRLRMRHAPFAIGQAERDAWLRHMTAAVESAEGLDPTIAGQLLDYFTMAADHLVNR